MNIFIMKQKISISTNELIASLANFFSKNKEILFILFVTTSLHFLCILDDTNQSLVAHDEGLYSRRARVISDSGNWLSPFQEAHHKTVGSYWLIALSIKLFGINETTVRAPSAIFSIFCSVLIYQIVSQLINKRSDFLLKNIFFNI